MIIQNFFRNQSVVLVSSLNIVMEMMTFKYVLRLL